MERNDKEHGLENNKINALESLSRRELADDLFSTKIEYRGNLYALRSVEHIAEWVRALGRSHDDKENNESKAKVKKYLADHTVFAQFPIEEQECIEIIRAALLKWREVLGNRKVDLLVIAQIFFQDWTSLNETESPYERARFNRSSVHNKWSAIIEYFFLLNANDRLFNYLVNEGKGFSAAGRVVMPGDSKLRDLKVLGRIHELSYEGEYDDLMEYYSNHRANRQQFLELFKKYVAKIFEVSGSPSKEVQKTFYDELDIPTQLQESLFATQSDKNPLDRFFDGLKNSHAF